MKKLRKVLLYATVLWTCALNLSAQVAARESNVPESKSTISIHPIDIMANPQTLMKVWIDDPLPLSFYTPKEKESQIRINQNNTNGIITYSPLSSEMEWTGIDIEEITPFTWKWIDFEQRKADSSVSKIQLRRPHWWIREMHAEQIGNKVYLDMPEMGLRGYAEVKNIRVNQLDTRFWNENREGDYVSRPITGKFEHESNDVYYLHFGDNPHPLGVTGSHPIWSIDRNDWVGASELKIGEKVKTHDGLTVLHSRIKSAERQKVYNLEVYKDHNFLVSTDKILVHNSCVPEIISKITRKFDNLECEECAEAVVKELQSLGIKGEIIDVKATVTKYGGLWSDKEGKVISTNGFHRAILVDGKVYDNIHKTGTNFSE